MGNQFNEPKSQLVTYHIAAAAVQDDRSVTASAMQDVQWRHGPHAVHTIVQLPGGAGGVRR